MIGLTIGILIGGVAGFLLCAMFNAGKISDLEKEKEIYKRAYHQAMGIK